MSEIIDEVPDETCGWKFDLSCCDWSEVAADPDVAQRAMNLAVATLRMLTGFRVGGCPVTVRPCAPNCGCGRGGFNPHIGVSGKWVNSCGHMGRGCGCGVVSRIVLPGPVGRVDSVVQDGVELTEGVDYLVYDTGLVRVGGTWPHCQDLTVPAGEEGTLTVTYLNAYVPDYGAAVAGGILACEYAKACQGKDCRLPRSVRSITRQGISMEMPAESFEGGLTGIREVDSWIKAWNPNGLKQAPQVYSLDMPQPAYQVPLS